jgi:DNA mismatch repair protein MutL
MGFRGEALPSIASVSRFSLITRDKDSEFGTEILVEGGKIIKVAEAGAPLGTMITVKDLFFNMPARRKFLKTINTETGHIADIISSLALANPQVKFTLLNNGKTVFNWPVANNVIDRALDILGKELKNDLSPLKFDEDIIKVSGWAASDRHTKSTSAGIYIFVNKRFVKDKIVAHALFEGYSGRLMKGRFPVVVIFLELPFDHVDVNVHPTKNEVRFFDQKKVHDAVLNAVSHSLKNISNRLSSYSAAHKTDYQNIFIQDSVPILSRQPSPFSIAEQQAGGFKPINESAVRQKNLWDKKFFDDLAIIGQLHNTYILCESEEGLVLIDQHAAHERIVYELIKKSGDRTLPKQRLLIPEVVEFNFREAKIIEDLLPELENTGLEIEPFGNNTFAIKSVPSFLSDREIRPVLAEMVERIIELGFTDEFSKIIEECHKILACHSAVRARQELSEKHIKGLLCDLDNCENPNNCPHGRPTWISFTKKTLEKSFGRTD